MNPIVSVNYIARKIKKKNKRGEGKIKMKKVKKPA